MSDNDFKSWMEHCGFNTEVAAERLGISKYQATVYDIGEEAVPRYIKDKMFEVEKLLVQHKRQSEV